MVFSSITFLLYFLPIFLLVYHFIRKEYKNYVILLASVFFYSWGAPKFVFILLASTFLDFYLVRWMSQATQLGTKKRLLFFSIFLNLGLLAYFKYANFFIENVNTALSGLGMEAISWTSVVLPIGISFYTFQTLTYSIDVYRKVHEPLDRVTDYMLYIIMFPQLIAGPIVRFNAIADQIVHRTDDYDDKVLGFYRFCIGLSKKVLIANVMGAKADEIIGMGGGDISTPVAWIGMLAYTFQIYFDFSGYSDMAIGLGRMMGFKFPENFNNPYISKSITEFWQRWHITLGTWMRDYLYIPLGGNRVSAQRMYFNLWFVFVVSGLWHGASWNFVLWGIFHGVFLVIERLFLGKLLKKSGAVFSLIYTFIITVLGWVIFRIEDAGAAFVYYKKMLAFDMEGNSVLFETKFKVIFGIAVFFSFFILFPFGKKIQDYVFGEKYSNGFMLLMFIISWLLFAVCVGAITTSSFNPFIYFRF